MNNEAQKLYTIKYRPYPNWGIWTIDRFFTKEDLEKFKKEKEIIKIIKRTKKWLQKNGYKLP